ncbi:hypothetical protein LTR49_007391 [Elasticomyces elasticus]|nr:hypothetical protein LTR49_007391 [Elasticomyces elasticus]
MANETRPQRRANADVSTRAQQRYGSVLPPSLRKRLRHVPETQDADEVDSGLQQGDHTSPHRPATRRGDHQAIRLEGPRRRDQRERSPQNITGVIERPVAVGTLRPLPGQSVHGSARSNLSAGSTSPQNQADSASYHSHQPEVTTYAKRIDLGRLDADDSDDSDDSAESTESDESIASVASDSMRVYLPPKLTGSGSRALEADAKGSSLPIDDSLHLNSKVSVERYCIYPSTYFQAQCQKESALPAYPDASLLRSPGVDRPKHVGTFEWIHMEQSVLNLFQFKRLVLEHLKVGPNARTLIAQNIDDFELDTNQPDSGPTFAKPHCKRLLGGEDDEQQSTIMLALPLVYLHDSKGDRHIVPLASSEEPNPNHRTLLQMLFPRMGGNVSEQQALYHSAGHSGYLHVTQLWCIMLNGGNEETLITCSTMPEATLRGDSISSTTVPPSIKPPSLLGNHVEVVDLEGRMWILQPESCRTWFEFELQLSEISVEASERFCYRHEGRRVLPQDWPKLMSDHQEISLRVDMYIEGFLNFTSAKDTKLYEACEKRTAAQAFAGPYGPTQSVQMPAASVDTADASTKDDNLGSKGSIESDDHGSGEVATENDLYRILMNFIWPLTHLFAPSYRTEGGSRASLKFWGAMQTFAIGFVQLYLARGVRLPRRLRKEDFLIRLEKTYAPFRLLNAVQKLLSYGCSREILVEGEQVPGSNVSMPQDFQLAYREVMLAFLHVTEPESAVSKRHFSKARKLLKSSFYDLLEDIPRPPLLTREAVSAKGLLALIVRQCTGSVIPGGADLITLFSQQITAMVSRQQRSEVKMNG